MQDIYVNMQFIYVNTQDIYVKMRLSKLHVKAILQVWLYKGLYD